MPGLMGLDVAHVIEESIALRGKGIKTYLIFSSKFGLAVSEMTAVTFDTILVLLEMLAQCSLIEVVELLATRLLLGLDDGLLAVLRPGLAGWPLVVHVEVFSQVLLLKFSHLLSMESKTRFVVAKFPKWAI